MSVAAFCLGVVAVSFTIVNALVLTAIIVWRAKDGDQD